MLPGAAESGLSEQPAMVIPAIRRIHKTLKISAERCMHYSQSSGYLTLSTTKGNAMQPCIPAAQDRTVHTCEAGRKRTTDSTGLNTGFLKGAMLISGIDPCQMIRIFFENPVSTAVRVPSRHSLGGTATRRPGPAAIRYEEKELIRGKRPPGLMGVFCQVRHTLHKNDINESMPIFSRCRKEGRFGHLPVPLFILPDHPCVPLSQPGRNSNRVNLHDPDTRKRRVLSHLSD